MLAGVHKVVLYVNDQDQAKRFWTERMGFDLVQDTPYRPGERWLEVRTPDRNTILVLSPRIEGWPEPDIPAELPTSNVFFACDDLEATCKALAERGVAFPQPPIRQPWGWWSLFSDQDGNRYALSEAGG